MVKVSVTNEANLIEKKLRQLEFTRNQIYGFFFYLGSVSTLTQSKEESELVIANTNRLARFDKNALIDELVSKYYSGKIEKVFDEFLFKSGLSIDCRQIEVEGIEPLTLFNEVDHGYLPIKMKRVDKLADAEKLFMALIEFIGSELQHDEITVSEAMLCGIFQIQVIAQMDSRAVFQLKTYLLSLAPPIFVGLRTVALSSNAMNIGGFMDIQLVLQGLWGGLTINFLETAWSFQRMLFFKNGDVNKIEFKSYESVFNFCCEEAQKLFHHDFEVIPKLSETNVSLEGLIKWPAIIGEYEAISNYIEHIWGFSDNNIETYSQELHYKSFIIHCVFSSLALSKETIN